MESPAARGRPTRRQRATLRSCLLWSGALLLALVALTALGSLAGSRVRRRSSPYRARDELLIRADPARGASGRAQRLLDQALPGAGRSTRVGAGAAGGLGSSPAADGSGSGAAATAALADKAAVGREAGRLPPGRTAEAEGRCGELRVPKVRCLHTSV